MHFSTIPHFLIAPQRMVQMLMFLWAMLSVTACTAPSQETQKPRPWQVTVVLDLSDRILDEEAVARDQAMIAALYERWQKEAHEQTGTILQSKHRFQVRVAEQTGVPYKTTSIENDLSLDLGNTPVPEKHKATQKLKRQLKPRLAQLYRKARFSDQNRDYPGCDLWKFMNEDYRYHYQRADSNIRNTLLICTNGYLDFEQYNHTKKQSGFSTSTRFVRKLRGNSAWRKMLEEGKVGILPIEHQYPGLEMIVSGFAPAVPNNLEEGPLVEALWRQWAASMHADTLHFLPLRLPQKQATAIFEKQ